MIIAKNTNMAERERKGGEGRGEEGRGGESGLQTTLG